MQTAARPIQTRSVLPAQEQDNRALNPTATRYGWCPFGDINLTNPDGTMNMYVQPHEVDMDGQSVPNENARLLPKSQLIPFPTFNSLQWLPSQLSREATLIETRQLITAKEAIETVKQRYSAWGFTIIDALQGIDQDTAFRIFQVVHPLAYPLGDIERELTEGADARIDSHQPITFADYPDYVVEPLYSETERETARLIASQMSAGASVAVQLAESTLNDTEQSMTTRFAGGQGKTGADALDKRLSAEMGRELPKMVGQANKNEGLGEKIDFLVTREVSRSQQEELNALRARVAELETQKPVETAIDTVCNRPKANGDPCQYPTKNGEPCHLHKAE
jgi:hypothetical protein